MDEMVKDHEKTLRDFEQASRQLDDGELRAWIHRMVPLLRLHLERARKLSTYVPGSAQSAAERH